MWKKTPLSSLLAMLGFKLVAASLLLILLGCFDLPAPSLAGHGGGHHGGGHHGGGHHGGGHHGGGGGSGGGQQIPCPHSRYRTMNGSCNNLQRRNFGEAGTPLARWMLAAYENNDGSTLKQTGKDGKPLPNPRLVSTKVHPNNNMTMLESTLMLMQWGQFLDHDVTLTPESEGYHGTCCPDGLVESGVTEHPNVTSGQGECMSIIIPANDRYFMTTSTRCMEMVRSKPLPVPGTRQQINGISHWVDGSQVYSHDDTEARSLRTLTNGKLKVKNVNGADFLPDSNNPNDCFILSPSDYCFTAGDIRANVLASLAVLHTIFVRHHNKVVDKLMDNNPPYINDDEITYQEARRIVVAVLQKITYDEYLKELMGVHEARRYRLLSEDPYKYDPHIDPSIANVFATAAYRHGHTLIPDGMSIDGQFTRIDKMMLRPGLVLNSLPAIVRALTKDHNQLVDRFYTDSMTDKLFEKPQEPQSGFDIVSRNIRRGRDHGLPSYNEWLYRLGFQKIQSFSSLASGGEKFADVYKHVDDIDVYSGGVVEPNVPNAKLGRLFLKIIGEQFKRLKLGDRYWFEKQGESYSFSPDQLLELHKVKLSHVICETVPEITSIQRDVFRQSSAKISCPTLISESIRYDLF